MCDQCENEVSLMGAAKSVTFTSNGYRLKLFNGKEHTVSLPNSSIHGLWKYCDIWAENLSALVDRRCTASIYLYCEECHGDNGIARCGSLVHSTREHRLKGRKSALSGVCEYCEEDSE